MRSSKSRSRGKSNRNRNQSSGGNVVNRVFDSSGPSGKVRGTPQQIIDKYNQLARDAQLSNDRVATENYQQHAEHYMRLLSEAQREADAKREEHERQNRERQADRDRERAERLERSAEAPAATPKPETNDPGAAPQPDVLEMDGGGSEGDSGLVETPEGGQRKPKPKPRSRSRKPAAKPAEASPENPAPAPTGDEKGAPESPEAAE